MRFRTAGQGKLFFAVLLGAFIVLCSYVLFHVRNSNPALFLPLVILAAALSLFAIYLYLSTANPDVVVNQEGVFFERGFLGKRVSLKKVVDLKRVHIKLKKNEMRIYSGWKIIFIRKCLLVLIDHERSSAIKKMMHLGVLDYREFCDEIFKRAQSIEISAKTFDVAQEMHLAMGPNVNLKKGMTIRKEKSLLDEFASSESTVKQEKKAEDLNEDEETQH